MSKKCPKFKSFFTYKTVVKPPKIEWQKAMGKIIFLQEENFFFLQASFLLFLILWTPLCEISHVFIFSKIFFHLSRGNFYAIITFLAQSTRYFSYFTY